VAENAPPPPAATKRSKPIHQVALVMIQVELPPYRGPHNPLDLVAIEIIFGRIFKAFRQISQATTADATAIDDDKALKRMHHPSLKKVCVPT
jgi:hypothetical protein